MSRSGSEQKKWKGQIVTQSPARQGKMSEFYSKRYEGGMDVI